MAVYDMDDALSTARSQHVSKAQSKQSSNPTTEISERYNRPIAAAQESGLPIIDISSYLDPNSSLEARQTTAQAINAACVNYGFFYLTGHGVPTAKLDEIIDLARQFFALPIEEKNKIKRYDAGGPEGGDSARGYQGLGENVTGGLQDMQEAIDFYRPWSGVVEQGDGGPGTRKTLQGPNLWPEKPVSLRAEYEAYIAQVTTVGRALVRAMGVALSLGAADPDNAADGSAEDEDVFARNCDESFWVMRMINYPPLSASVVPAANGTHQDPGQFSCGAHTDYGCVTLLLADPTPGALQVQLKDGTWLPADPIRGAFVVNIGDMIERWTNGMWKSTMHRVIHRGDGGVNGAQGGGRVSVPFFFEPNFDALVRPLGKCVRESGRESVHGGSTYGEHLLTKVFSNFYYSKRTDW
ncbi:Clavaminate synthase-like protein [Didymella exigua CBS 183.55]|uniref:Clavaminate synthase-like protein n=1 Tax=Didymella exigua CBS 183.55 TaxID=1150837 RepID=A0A6A5RQ94_9PLEO|nr:Clavaminate synthase-like protein [Didymella exigua CBS 183.55]KAF1929952.1 Clavaminate synthase-like protein [Didymella exigua CBS 183.55]